MIAPNQFTSEWMNAAELTAKLELGDRIEIRRVLGRNQRQIYAHWALFIGYYEDMACVAHVTTNSGDFDVNVTDVINPSDSVVDLTTKFVKGSQAQVQQGELTRVARTDMCRINNSLDRLRKPFPPSIIVTRALLMLGSGGYNILFNNCEHFVNHCRYGSKESEQASVVKSVLIGSAALALSGSLPIAVASGCLGYTFSKFGYAIRQFVPFYPAELP